jgi:hypothetical protein
MDVMDFDLDEEEDLSTVLGTESLAARDMVPEGFDNTLRVRGVLELTQLGRRYTTRPYAGRPVGIRKPLTYNEAKINSCIPINSLSDTLFHATKTT